jgi:threonine dehydrogenase-like Zn-dependent dehydrogenase
VAGSLRLDEAWPEPHPEEGAILVEALAVGICGTDHEIIAGKYGAVPPGADQLVLGHESLGRVLEDPTGTLHPGDLVAGIVRRPDPVPCANCAVDEWDMCRNGRYTEHGIKALPGFARDRWRVSPKFAVGLAPELAQVGVLLEPTSVVAKAWDHIDRIGQRAEWQPQTVLVTGAGPIGLLAALLASQRGLTVHVLDRAETGPKPTLVAALGATYHTSRVDELDFEPDIIVECTGAPSVVLEVMCKAAPVGIVCLTGVSSGGRTIDFDAGALNRAMVLENNVVFGSVNANRRHWELAAVTLGRADPSWLGSLITRRVPVEAYAEAYRPGQDDIKVVLEFAG